jgi:hypothetical protein
MPVDKRTYKFSGQSGEGRSLVPIGVPVVNQFFFNSLWFWPKVCLELVFNKMLTIHEKL